MGSAEVVAQAVASRLAITGTLHFLGARSQREDGELLYFQLTCQQAAVVRTSFSSVRVVSMRMGKLMNSE